ncbi:MAG: NAD(P)-dependent oxidoreductase [Terricaulis sp.]|nr:NAD(P)-dependent oxidoreductase [Terricaulis sp.]
MRNGKITAETGERRTVALVTGGAGFLGSHVADALTKAGHKVLVFDRRPSPYLSGDQEMLIGDLNDRDTVEAAVRGADYVYHLGAIADIQDCADDPVAAARINVLGTVNLLEACRRHSVKRFVFSSSAYIYSRHGGFYRASKQAAEAFVQTFAEAGGPPFTVMRYGSLYGRRSGPKNRIYRMISDAMTKGAIDFPGHGEATRDFINVLDAARMSVGVLDPKYENKFVLVTGYERFRVRDVAAMIREILDRDIKLNFAEGEPPGHYLMTPFTFKPEMAEKIVAAEFIEFGHGLLDCIHEQHEAAQRRQEAEVPAKGPE